MGFLDSLISVAIKAKCATGFHAGEFHKVDDKPECYREKTCPDCGETVTEHEHKYPERNEVQYNSRNSCEKTLICTYCGFKKNLVDHEQFDIAGTNGHCEIIEKCVRCKHERNNGKSAHNWVRQRGNEESTVTYECYNCGKKERRNY